MYTSLISKIKVNFSRVNFLKRAAWSVGFRDLNFHYFGYTSDILYT